jgi:hypothetical protein
VFLENNVSSIFSFSHFSLSECYFAGKGTALMLGSNERLRSMDCRRSSDVSNEDPSGPPSGNSGSDIQQHLQSMFYLLRPEETLKMVIIIFRLDIRFFFCVGRCLLISSGAPLFFCAILIWLEKDFYSSGFFE